MTLSPAIQPLRIIVETELQPLDIAPHVLKLYVQLDVQLFCAKWDGHCWHLQARSQRPGRICKQSAQKVLVHAEMRSCNSVSRHRSAVGYGPRSNLWFLRKRNLLAALAVPSRTFHMPRMIEVCFYETPDTKYPALVVGGSYQAPVLEKHCFATLLDNSTRRPDKYVKIELNSGTGRPAGEVKYCTAQPILTAFNAYCLT